MSPAPSERGYDTQLATYVFDLIAKFAGYGFNKAHAAAYAMIAYQTAYLKANYPVEFLAASMTLDINNTDKLGQFRQELVRLGETLLPPDVNHSEAVFAVERITDEDGQGASRRPLCLGRDPQCRHPGDGGAGRRAQGERPVQGSGRFRQPGRSAVVNKRQLENMAMAGAFDGL